MATCRSDACGSVGVATCLITGLVALRVLLELCARGPITLGLDVTCAVVWYAGRGRVRGTRVVVVWWAGRTIYEPI